MKTDSKTVVLVINDLKGNGAERVVITLADQLIELGHQCHIICFKRFRELPSTHPLNIHIFPLQYLRWIPRKWRGKTLAPLLDRFICRQAGGTPDLVLSNLIPADRILCVSKLPNVHLIMHNTLSQQEQLHRKTVEQRDQAIQQLADIYTRQPIVCVSRGVENDLRQLFPNHKHVNTIYNPVDAKSIINSAKTGALGTEIPAGGYLIHVGKFNHAKRHDRLLRAYADSKVELPLVLVGQGPLLEDTKKLSSKLGLNNKVIFAGFYQNPYPLIANAQGMILTSDYEGLGMVILEAIILDTPVISTDCPSGPGEILPAKNLVPTEDETALALKIYELASRPIAFKTLLSEHFTPEVAVMNYLALTPASSE